jgi:hypothetical protein
MGLIVRTGTATNVSLGTDVTYAASAQYGPIAQHNHAVTLRLDSKPVFFRTRQMPSISEGDQVVVAGFDKNGTLQALALRNLTTGAIYCPATTLPIAGSIFVIVLGIPLIPVLGIGLFFSILGTWILVRSLKTRKAGAMVAGVGAAPQPA